MLRSARTGQTPLATVVVRYLLLLSGFGSFVLLLSTSRARRRAFVNLLQQHYAQATAEDICISFRVQNEYTERDGVIGDGRLPWVHIVEPFRHTTFTALLNEVECGAQCQAGTWDIDGYASQGEKSSFIFTRAGFHVVRFTLPRSVLSQSKGSAITEASTLKDRGDDQNNTPFYVYEARVMSKWVRRELRSLTDADREQFFDALHTLWYVDTKVGQARYHSTKYKSASYFVRKHLYGAASAECDHWHDNAGLMTHHMAFTLELEQSLQAIDPRVSVPYWEYSLDAEVYGTNWKDSIVFDDTWFGEASPPSPLRTVMTGRWAYTPVMSQARRYSNITNQWGLLRSPWNQNPVPFVSRHGKVLGNGEFQPTFPSCRDFNDAIKTTSFSEIMPWLNGRTHGPVHLMIGGQWHQNSSGISRFWTGSETNFLLMSKIVWRHGFVRCNDVCTEGVDRLDDCTCTCPTQYLDARTPYDIVVHDTGVMHWMSMYSNGMIYHSSDDDAYHIANYTLAEESRAWGDIYDALCNPGWVGDMYTSAAPADPIFYVIHTTAERFLWTRILLSNENPAKWPFNTSWGYDHTLELTPSDTGKVCSWDNVMGTLELPSCNWGTCPGHRLHDTIPFDNFLDDGETYTNAQFWDLMQPTNEKLPYTYDTFEYPWCTKSGYDWSA